MDCRAGLRTHESRGYDSSAGARPSREPVALAVALLCTFSPTVAGAVQALRTRASGRAHLFPVSSPGNDLPSGTPCSRNDYIGRESMLADRIRKHIQNLPLFLDAAENLKDIVRAWMPTSPRSKPRLRSSSTFASACVPKTATCASSSRRRRAMPSASTIESIRRAQSSRY
jgi:hypothetical protein